MDSSNPGNPVMLTSYAAPVAMQPGNGAAAAGAMVAATSTAGPTVADLTGGGAGAVAKAGSAGSPLGSLLSDSDTQNISSEDIQKVQNLIEKCLQLYMTQEEVVNALKAEAAVLPRFTTLVWQKLEEQNPEFFRAYYTRLKLKDQIVLFNHLLEQQVQMFQKIHGGWMQAAGPPVLTAQQRPPVPVSLALPTLPAVSFPPRPIGLPIAAPALASAVSMPPPAPRPVAEAIPATSGALAATETVPAQQPSTAFLKTSHAAVSGSEAAPAAAASTTAPGAMPTASHENLAAAATASSLLATSLPQLAVQGVASPGDALVAEPAAGAAASGPATEAATDMGGLPRSFSLSDLNLDLQANLSSEGDGSLGLLNSIPTDDHGLDLGIDLDIGGQA